MQLHKAVVLITGGGSGIGRAIALAIAQEGGHVIICGRTKEKLEKVATECSPPLQYYVCDVSKWPDVDNLFTQIESTIGPVDVLINAAGVNIHHRQIQETHPTEFEHLLQINCLGTYNCIFRALPSMKDRGRGFIVNIISISGKKIIDFAGVGYCASKFAQSSVGNFVNIEYAKYGIRCVNIYPGEVNTPILDLRPNPPPLQKRQQMLQPEDIAQLILFLIKLPERVLIPELIIIPPYQSWS